MQRKMPDDSGAFWGTEFRINCGDSFLFRPISQISPISHSVPFHFPAHYFLYGLVPGKKILPVFEGNKPHCSAHKCMRCSLIDFSVI